MDVWVCTKRLNRVLVKDWSTRKSEGTSDCDALSGGVRFLFSGDGRIIMRLKLNSFKHTTACCPATRHCLGAGGGGRVDEAATDHFRVVVSFVVVGAGGLMGGRWASARRGWDRWRSLCIISITVDTIAVQLHKLLV